MNKGTERDKTGERSEDRPQDGIPADSSRASADPVWPVWGGSDVPTAAGEPALPTEEPEAIAVDAEAAAAADEAGESERPTDEAATEDVSADAAGEAAPADDPEEPAVEAAPSEGADEPELPTDEAAVEADESADVTGDDVVDDSADVPDIEADEPAAAVDPVAGTDEPDVTAAADVADEPDASDVADESAVVDATDAADATDEPGVAAATDEPDVADATDEPDVADATDEPDVADATDEPDAVGMADAADEPDEPGTLDEPDAVRAVDLSNVADETGVETAGSDAADPLDAADEPPTASAADDTEPPADDAESAATEPDAASVASATAPDADSVPDAEPDPAPTSDRDDATEVITPVAVAAAAAAATSTATASTGAATAPRAIGTLEAPVTRTVPAAHGAPAAPVAPAAAAAAPTAPVDSVDTAPAETAAVPAAATTAPLPSGPVPPSAAGAAAGATSSGGPIPSGPVPPSERSESPLDVFESDDGKRRWPKRLLVVGSVVVALGAVYTGASYALADRVPRGTTVAGVDIGGLPADDAVARLNEDLSDATTTPIEVVANDIQATIDPATAGLTFDAQATVDAVTGVNLAEPQRLWGHLVGVGEQAPATTVDEDALEAAIGDLGASLALAPVDGTVVFVDGAPQSTKAEDGSDLDQAGAADVLAADWLVAARPLELPTVTVEPDITQAETDAALTVAQQVTSAPVSVAVAEQAATLDAPTLAANASFVPTDGDLALQMNGEGLAGVVLAQLPDLLTESADAHFEFVNDAPVIIPGTPGTTLDPAALAASVATAATTGDRTAPVELVEADPSQSTAELEALGIKEIVGEHRTPLNREIPRTVNIKNGAEKITGTLVRPGETFSLTDALGPIDAAHGFVPATAIISGEHQDAWGGGLSQISTTTYNAAFLAGFEDVEHKPHSEWFSRYPEGREATLFTGTLDMRWKNNTPYGALVQSWVADGWVNVRIWGTKHWTVESITSPRSGVVPPTTVYSQSPTCTPQSAGNPGFSVTVTRKTSLNGELVKTESNSWRYKPQNKVICGAPPAPTAPATP